MSKLNTFFLLLLYAVTLGGCGDRDSSSDPSEKVVKERCEDCQLRLDAIYVHDDPLLVRNSEGEQIAPVGYGVRSRYLTGNREDFSQDACVSGTLDIDNEFASLGYFGHYDKYLDLYIAANPFRNLQYNNWDVTTNIITLHKDILSYATKSLAGATTHTLTQSQGGTANIFEVRLKDPVSKDGPCDYNGRRMSEYVSSVTYGYSFSFTYKLVFSSASAIGNWQKNNNQSPMFSVFSKSSIDAKKVSELLQEAGLQEMSITFFQIGGNPDKTEAAITNAGCSVKNIEACRGLGKLISEEVHSQISLEPTEEALKLLVPISFFSDHLTE